MRRYTLAIILSVIFFVVCLFTLPKYGINWDTINHLPRGQAYLHYFLTGEEDYSKLTPFKNYFQDPTKLGSMTDQSRSFYQTNAADFKWFMEYDGSGHPPLSDILSSIFNRVLYGKLHLVNDIDAYRVYGVFLASILVGVIFLWVRKNYGTIAGLMSAFVLASYPLFFSEAHFNTEKDIPETAYWSFFVFSIWKGFTGKSVKWILLSGVFFGFALATKLNIVFSSFVIIPWIVTYLIARKKGQLRRYFKVLLAGLVAFLIGFFIFVGSWPYLWVDPITRIQGVIGFYKGIGTDGGNTEINTMPLLWIIYSTQPVLLLLALGGLVYACYLLLKKKDLNILLILLWFFVPILRVSMPQSNIYGGVRQIMEYIPALAILVGVFASFIYKKIKFGRKMFLALVVVFALIPIIKVHPNENTYFNFLTNGLRGAKEKDFQSWGNSFGAAYRQGVQWLNANAKENATVVFAYELVPNVPTIWFRSDLTLNNRERSGSLKKGEYAMTLTYDGTSDRTYYDAYLENIVNPTYEVKSGDVAILKIWENRIENTKNEYLIQKKIDNFKIQKNSDGFVLAFNEEYRLSRVEVGFTKNVTCKPIKYAFSEISRDNTKWVRLPGTMPKEDWNTSAFGEQPKETSFIQPFAGNLAKYVRYSIFPNDACMLNIKNIEVYAFN